MHGPPCAFNQIRVSPGSRHGLPWAFLCCYTQGCFCLPSIYAPPVPVAMQDGCCLLDVEAYLFLTGSHRKIKWLEPVSTVHNGPSIKWHGDSRESVTASSHYVIVTHGLSAPLQVIWMFWCLPCSTFRLQYNWETPSVSMRELHHNKSWGAAIL